MSFQTCMNMPLVPIDFHCMKKKKKKKSNGNENFCYQKSSKYLLLCTEEESHRGLEQHDSKKIKYILIFRIPMHLSFDLLIGSAVK